MRYLILGNGVAGTYAAKAVFEIDTAGEIIIISNEEYPFYFRPRLPQLVAGDLTAEKITVFNSEWYVNQQIKLKLKETVKEINPARQTIVTDRETYTYDRLLLALGSQPQYPPILGLEGQGVFSLRTIADALQLQKLGTTYKKAILIGGGLLGLEAAFGLIKLGVEVVVVEYFDRLLPRQMDMEGAVLLQKRLEKLGFKFKIGAISEKVSGELGKKTLFLKNSEPVVGDFILVSAGIKSNIDLLQASGITCKRGVVVNNRLQTNIEGIYAAGDIAEFEGRIYGIWPAGLEQGLTAGHNMGGREDFYKGTVPSTTLKVAGIDLSSLGKIADFTGEVREYKRVNDKLLSYAKIFIQQEKIVGGIFLGEVQLSRQIQFLIKKEISVLGYEDKLLSGTFDFSIFN